MSNLYDIKRGLAYQSEDALLDEITPKKGVKILDKYSFTIGKPFLIALVNSDETGLTATDSFLLDTWLKKFEQSEPRAYTINLNYAALDEVNITLCQVSKLYTDCINVDFLIFGD